MKQKYFILLFVFIATLVLISSHDLKAQKIGIETNAMLWATTTPNVGLSFKLSNHSSISLNAGYNPWKFQSNKTNSQGYRYNPKLMHWSVQPEYKYWFCKVNERSYIGVHGNYLDYNVEGIPFISAFKHHRYKGYGVGGGVSYGYQWALGNRWGVELSAGVGYIYLKYDKYEAGRCGELLGAKNKHYIGPTKAALSFILYIE